MKDELFAELLQAANEALDHARGKRELRTTVLPDAPQPMVAAEIRQLRATLHASQAVFARYLNVSTSLVQAWEAQRRRPDGAALKLLRVAEKQPAILLADIPADTASRIDETARPVRQKKGARRQSSSPSPRFGQGRRASA